MFKLKKLNGNFIEGNIFNISNLKLPKFNIIFNTGLLEHFSKKEQKEIINNTYSLLKEKGYYITSNPSSSGSIYIKGKEYAEKKETWPFGYEKPIKSLNKIKGNFILEKEFITDFFSQLNFLNYYSQFFRIITIPIKLIGKTPILGNLLEKILIKKFGGYLIISILKK